MLSLAEALLRRCESNWNTTSVDVCDRVVHELQIYVHNLAEYMDSLDTIQDGLITFSRCMSYLLVHWETKLLRLEGGQGHNIGGRPRKAVSMELVSQYRIPWFSSATVI